MVVLSLHEAEELERWLIRRRDMDMFRDYNLATDEELTSIYNQANGLDPKRHNPITTERIFTAMRGAIAAEREACAKVCEAQAIEPECPERAQYCAYAIRLRSNAEFRRSEPQARDRLERLVI